MRASRVDKSGRAYAGSQRWLQYYVNCNRPALNAQIMSLAGMDGAAEIEWASPLARARFAEYRDVAFLNAVGYPALRTQLRTFWPRGGPCWDALAKIRSKAYVHHGVLVVEAKSYPGEVIGNGCQAGPKSLAKIESAVQATKSWLAAQPSADWLGDLYQSANRLAHLYFFRQIAHVPAWLVNVYFLNDPRTPTDRAEWERGIAATNEALGVRSSVPYTLTVFLEAKEI